MAFKDETQYHAFCDDLAACVRENLRKFRDWLMPTVASHLTGFLIIVNGTAATLYSEAPGEKRGRLFDQNGKGTSDLNVAIVFEAAQLNRDGQKALTAAIFFGRASRSGGFRDIQYACS